MEAASIGEKNHLQCLDLKNDISVMIDKISSGKGTLSYLPPYMIYLAAKDYFVTQSLIRKIRKQHNECSNICQGTEIEGVCLDQTYDLVVGLRDNYVNLVEFLSHRKIMGFFLMGITRKSLMDWDDLVEDFTIAKDTEIRELLYSISEAL